MDFFSDKYFMRIALQQAKEAFEKDEIPVGCIIVSNNRIIAKTHNLTETLIDVTAHAEIQAITAASIFLGAKYLKECTMYVTLEPCMMCCGALYWSQIGKVVIGAKEEKRGFIENGGKLHPKTKLITDVLEDECSKILKDFFRLKRGRNN